MRQPQAHLIAGVRLQQIFNHNTWTCVRNVHTLPGMEANWDRRKERANIRKHGVDFSDAAVALEDEHTLCVAFYENDEQRLRR